MGRRKTNKGGPPPAPAISEESRTQLDDTLQSFLQSNQREHVFGTELTTNERAYVHRKCLKLDLKSKSSGRFRAKENVNAKDVVPRVELSEGSAEVLGDLFSRYPPGDGEGDVERRSEGSRKFEKALRKKDPLFRGTAMGREEVARKVETQAKMKNSKITADRLKLPMASYKDAVTSTVESNQVVLISGETGCGKTTQVPQYLLDHMWGKGKPCKIVCTQPRRISAISVAERISYEKGQNVGRDIGYMVKLLDPDCKIDEFLNKTLDPPQSYFFL